MAQAALFDVDGTLADTNYLHVVAWWEAFRQSGHGVAMRSIHRAVGLAGGDLMDTLLPEDRDRSQDKVISDAHKTLYGTYFDRLPSVASAADLLRALAARGWQVVLVTSAAGFELSALRRAIDADDVIAHTAAATDVSSGKPAPDQVEYACQLAGVTAQQAVLVGDSVWDMQAANRAGSTAVGLLSGGLSETELRRAGASEVYEDPADLLAKIEQSAFARSRQR